MALLAVQEINETDTATSTKQDPSAEVTHAENPDVNNDDPWSKRYADLRRYHDKEKQELNNKIKQLEDKINGATSPLPSSPEDIETFKKKYPEVYKVIQTEALKSSTSSSATFKTVTDKLENLEREHRKTQEILKLHRQYPGFESTLNDSTFRKWLSKQDENVKDLINSDRADDWGALFDSYNKYKKNKQLPTSEDSLNNSNSPRTSSARTDNAPTRQWTLEQIKKLSAEEYMQHEKEIMAFFAGQY